MSNIPAVCVELRIHVEGGAPVVNSRDVAEAFDKQHQHVLRDIDAILKTRPDLDRSWFRPTTNVDAYGREQPSFDLTRQGFTLLVMGWNGERAMAFKVRYIEAFDAMEEALKAATPATHADLIQTVREIVGPLAVRFDTQDVAIERVEARVDAIAEDVGSIKLRLFNSRKRISPTVRTEHADAIRILGGRCPCCGVAEVIKEGSVSRFADYDHFYQNSKADADHSWLICKPCHNDLAALKAWAVLAPSPPSPAVIEAMQPRDTGWRRAFRHAWKPSPARSPGPSPCRGCATLADDCGEWNFYVYDEA